MTPSCSDFQPLVDVEDLTFPPGWRKNACKVAQRRRTCPDLRAKSVTMKIRIRASQVVSHIASFPQRDAHCNDCSRKFSKGLPRSPPSVLKNRLQRIFSLSHTWLTGHVLCPASTLLTYARPNGKSKYVDQYHVTCVSSNNARLFRLSATCGC